MVRSRDVGTFWKLISRFLWPYRKAVFAVLVLSCIAGFAKALQPLIFAPIVGLFTGVSSEPALRFSEINLNNLAPTLSQMIGLDAGNRWQVIVFGISCYIFLALSWAALAMLAFAMAIRTRMGVSRDMMSFLHRHLMGLPLAYFNQRKAGDYVSRMTSDSFLTASSLDTVSQGLLQSATEVLIYGYILFRTDARLSLTILGLGTIHLFITRALSSGVRKSTQKTYADRGYLSHRFLESLQGMRIIKSFSSERFESSRIAQAIANFHNSATRNRTLMYSETPARHIADAILVSAALVLSFLALSKGSLQTVGFIMYVGLCMKAIVPVAELSKQLLQLSRSVGGATRINEVLSYVTPLADGPKDTRELASAIALDHVGFSYVAGGRPVLQDISLTIEKGQTVAFVGPSGSGKTTLADLILRLYDPTSGSITYDGTDVRDFKQRPYRKHFGVVAQEPILFHMSVRENIVYSRHYDRELLERAIAIANVSEFVDQLPDGLDSIVGDRGVLLSGGQRQRIAIARAVYGHPSILVLDEATSSLDSKSEMEVQQAIARAVEGLTAIIIAHRLSTITHADKIVVLKEGRMEACGRHEELLEKSPTYRFLHDLQYGKAPAGSKHEH